MAGKVRKKRVRKGFICPRCNRRTEVESTHAYAAGQVVRYRECPAGCGYRVVTEERPAKGRRPRPAG